MSNVELDCAGYILECKLIAGGPWGKITWVGNEGFFPTEQLAAEALKEFLFPKSGIFTHRIVRLEKRVVWSEV